MMRIFDAITLAATKLRMHRIRTGITVGVAGVLFGVLLAVTLVSEGMFRSIDSFNKAGLGSRYILMIHGMDNSWGVYEYAEDPGFVTLVEKEQAALTTRKQAAAKKYNVEYDAKVEDPPLVVVSEETDEKVIDDNGIMGNSPFLTELAEDYHASQAEPFSIDEFVKPYGSAKVLGDNTGLVPEDGLITYMKDGKEMGMSESERRTAKMGFASGNDNKTLSVLPQTLADPFISNQGYDPSSGELPIIFPYTDAESLLKLDPLPKTATPQQKRDRIKQVRDSVGDITVSFCYRNQASESLVQQAKATAEVEGESSAPLVYQLPADGSCGAVKVKSDTRSDLEKQQAENYKAYQKEIGEFIGEPEQHKLTFRGVGISGDDGIGNDGTAAGVIQGLLTSSLGYGLWNIPDGLLEEAPAELRPASVFESMASTVMFQTKLVEFGEKEDARAVLRSTGFFDGGARSVASTPYGSSSLVIDEMRSWVDKALGWAMFGMGMVAVLILSGLVARTIADGRKEAAVFRAIGATRGNMASVYVTYTLLFALRIVLFTLVLGIVLALTVHLLFYEDMTVGAQIAFGGIDLDKTFYLFDLRTWYLPLVAGVIVASALLAMVLPLLRNIRRNPIRDMRDDT